MLKHGLVLLLVLLASCGDDATHEDVVKPDAAGTGENAGGKTGGRGGAGSGGGVAGTLATSVKCGSTSCDVPPGVGAFITPCCADETKGVCGMSIMGAACSGASAGDPRCPSIQAMGLFSIPSCCTTSGQCGIDASMFGFGGCTDLASAAQMSMMSGSGTVIPAPRTCDAGDAGTEDAGG
ncbi:MAG TPA: hypothetical protein VJR89_11585 [Polyangiales bacterium]|nr:hypothetical protein [Polyangiales bacterium]